MVYCTASEIRLITNLTTSDISDADLTNLIIEATKYLNSKINVPVVREEIFYIDETRENKIDGLTTKYYIQNWFEKYLADSDFDGDVDASDLTVYAVDSNGTETEATISSIDTSEKSFTLSTAYTSGYRLYVSYEWCYRNPATPDALIALACKFITASLAYAKINIGRAPSLSFGNQRIMRHMDSFRIYMEKAEEIIEEINYKGANLKQAPTF